jgi:hypothetical protein
MYTYSLETKQWVEESVVFIAHETDQIGFYHLAGTSTAIYKVYGDNVNYETIRILTPEIELAGIGHINQLSAQIKGSTTLSTELFVDDNSVLVAGLNPLTSRKWMFVSLVDVLGQRIKLSLVSSNYVEIYNIEIHHTQLIDTVHFDSEFFVLPTERVAVNELRTDLFGLEDGIVSGQITVDGVGKTLSDITLQQNKVSTVRHVFTPTVGTVCRVNLSGVRFMPLVLTLGTTILGTGENKHIVIPLGTAA